MPDIAVLLGGLALLAIPGVCLWSALFPEQTLIERATWGTTAGLALAVLIAFYLAYLRLSLFWPVWLLCCAVSLVAAWMRRARSGGTGRDGTALWLAAILAAVAVSRFAPTFLRDTPPGWDPAFHLILARKLQLADHIFYDWTPFEAVPLIYPLGSHLLLVVLSRAAGLSLHRVFQLLICAFGIVSTAQVYTLARHVFRRSEVGVYAALAYGAWAFAGSVGYYAWGGLPNQLGMMFLVATLAMAADDRWDGRCTAAAAVFLAAIFVTHHHVMLASAAVIAATIAYLLLARADEGRVKSGGLALASVAAVMLASPYLVRHLVRLADIQATKVLRFTEPYSLFLMIAQTGIMLVACGVGGMIAGWRDERKRSGVLLATVMTLLVLYLACGPLYRAYSLQHWGHEYVAFTASRFLTDAVCFLSVFAGYAIYRVADDHRLTPRAVLAAGLLVALTNVPLWMGIFVRESGAARREAYAWIEQHTPTDAIVLTSDPWASYVTWRRTPDTPLPISEPQVLRNPARDAELALLARHTPQASFVVGVIAPGGVAARGTVIWKSASGWSVVQLWPETQVSRAPSAGR